MASSETSRVVEVAVGLDVFADVAADHVFDAAARAVRARGTFRVALAGGSTPRRVHAAIVADARSRGHEVEAWDVWFGDERCVPPDDAESNFRMADETLLSRLATRPRVHRVPTERGGPAQVAAAYEAELAEAFGLRPGERPRFDLVLLGLGADGHTASLFPGDPVLAERSRLVAAVRGPKPPPDRVTFTLPVLCAAREVLFLVTGAEKAAAVRDALEPGVVAGLPAGRVIPEAGRVVWLVEYEASRLLPASG